MNFKDQYPALKNCTYLDTASSGVISKETFKWRTQLDLAFFTQGGSFRESQAAFLNEVRDELSDFFNAKREYCFLLPNFSFGFNTFLSGLNPVSKFLLLEDDYPSVNYAIKTHLFPNESLKITLDLEEKLFEKIKQMKPDVFACSLVQYVNGYKINLNLLKKLKNEFPNLLIVVDGTQYCGTEAFDFKSSGIDFLGASGYKWMLAGFGNGFVLLSNFGASKIYNEARKKPAPIEAFLTERSRLGTFFEPGHLDTLAFGTLKQAIIERKKIGIDYIQSKIADLGVTAAEEFRSRNILTEPLIKGGSTQYIFNLKLNENALKALVEKKILFTRRGSGIRVAFNFYSEMDDLQKLLAVITSKQ